MKIDRAEVAALEEAASEQGEGFHIEIGGPTYTVCMVPLNMLPEEFPLFCCWHPTKEQAERAAAVIALRWKGVKVVAGECPNEDR